jgi:hypothetical protein
MCDHRAVIPLLLAILGIGTLAAGWLVMRRLGQRGRIGRILASTPVVPVDKAVEIATSGKPRYVGVGGRVDAEDEFLDENERPLVFRRTRLEIGEGGGWRTVEDTREALPFEIAGGAASIAVDQDDMDDGLVVVARESVGTAGEIPDRLPEGTPPATPARLQVEHVSTIDHALVLGVPTVDPERGPIMRAGFGRPLILTTLEPTEAMRLLAQGRQGAARASGALLALGAVLLFVGVGWGLVDALFL